MPLIPLGVGCAGAFAETRRSSGLLLLVNSPADQKPLLYKKIQFGIGCTVLLVLDVISLMYVIEAFASWKAGKFLKGLIGTVGAIFLAPLYAMVTGGAFCGVIGCILRMRSDDSWSFCGREVTHPSHHDLRPLNFGV